MTPQQTVKVLRCHNIMSTPQGENVLALSHFSAIMPNDAGDLTLTVGISPEVLTDLSATAVAAWLGY